MKCSKLALITTFFSATVFSMGNDTSTSTVEIVTDSNGYNTDAPDPCLNNTNEDAQQRCEQMWQEQRQNTSQGQNDTEMVTKQVQTTGPSHVTVPVPTTIPTQVIVPSPSIVPYTSQWAPSQSVIPSETTVIVPTPMPAWEQALQPQTTQTTNIQKEVIAPVESSTIVPGAQSSIPSSTRSTSKVPGAQQSLVPEDGHTLTDKETSTKVQKNGDVETVQKEMTITNDKDNIETDTTSTESIIHLDAPP